MYLWKSFSDKLIAKFVCCSYDESLQTEKTLMSFVCNICNWKNHLMSIFQIKINKGTH